MSHRSEDILTIFSSNQPISFLLWTKLLNYFEYNKEQLDLEDIKILVDKCEECRLYLNEHSYVRANPIQQHETFPNIYVHLEKMKIQKHKAEVTDKSPVRTTLIACHQ
jgi:hypothetical protein